MNKCVFLYRTEKWNEKIEYSRINEQMSRKANLFYLTDYFDFCLAVTPKNSEELFGRYANTTNDGKKLKIEESISDFNKNSSSKQVFSLCQGISKDDPFNQDKHYIIITTASLNPSVIEKCDGVEEIYERICKLKSNLYNFLNDKIKFLNDKDKIENDVFNVYNILSNEDFAIVIATDNPVNYYKFVLPDIRSIKDDYNNVIYIHTYTIQGYALTYNENEQRYNMRGKDDFDGEHILRGRVSKKFWEKYQCFPKIINNTFKVADSDNLIGKYNVIFKLNNTDFQKIADIIIAKKLGFEIDKTGISKTEINNLDDIIDFIKSNSFSYINERTIFDAYISNNNTTNDVNNDSVLQSKTKTLFIKLQESINNNLRELRNKCKVDDNREWNNNLYRISKINECCISMSRSLYLTPTTVYITEFIDLFLKELVNNYNEIHDDCHKECFTEYMNIGTSSINTLFIICTDKIYDNLQAPNYDVDYTYATEKMLRAYAQMLFEFCKKYMNVLLENTGGRNIDGKNSLYKPLVIPNPNNSDIYMRILFRDAAIRLNNLEININENGTTDTSETSSNELQERILIINCPFDKHILQPETHIPIMFHELGHYLPPQNRKERNQFFVSYLTLRLKIELIPIINNVLRDEYDFIFAEQCKEIKGGITIAKTIAEEFVNLIGELYYSALDENLFDIYVDQLRNLTNLLMSATENYHTSFWKIYQELKGMLELTEDDKKNLADNEMVLDVQYKALWSTDESEYKKDNININEKLCIYFNSIIKKADTNIANYKETCSKCFYDLEQECKKCLTLTKSVKDYVMNDEQQKGLVDYENEIKSKLKVLEYLNINIINAYSKLELTDELSIIRKFLIKKLYDNILKKISKDESDEDILCFHQRICREIGLTSDTYRIRKDKIDKIELFTYFIKKIITHYKEIYDEIVQNSRSSFREAIADYTMCKICKYDAKKYWDRIRKYVENQNDYNIDRIAIVVYMLMIDNNEDLNNTEAIINNCDDSIKNIIKATLQRMYSICIDNENNIVNAVKTINEACKSYILPYNIDNHNNDDENIEQITDFCLEYYYRSCINVIDKLEDADAECKEK